MSFQYTRADFKASLNERINNRKDMFTDFNAFVNESVRVMASKLDMRPMKRRASLDPNLFTDVFRYAAPADLNKDKVVNIIPQVNTEQSQRFYLTTPNDFFRMRNERDGMVAVEDYNETKTLLISAQVNDKSLTVATLDSLTSGGGTWESFGDGENLTADTDNFVSGNGSINWDISSAGGTTAGIKNTSLNSFDLDDEYLGGNGALFTWVYLSSATDVTNFILNIGSSESDYHSKTVTSAHNNAVFTTGWNLLKFDLTSMTDTGTPDDDAITYIAVYMTKDSGKVSETDYRFDNIVLRKGKNHYVKYYSRYPWQNTSNVFLLNSTDDSDYLVAEEEEYEILLTYAEERAFQILIEKASSTMAKDNLKEMVESYKLKYPSEAMIMSNEYYNY